MNIDTILTIRNEHLARLNPEEAVNFFRELLWAEATALGIGKNLINVPSAINVADGGIDAEVRDAEISGGQGIIKEGLTRYQIKTGDFNLSQNRYVNEILFTPNSSELKPRVKYCLDQQGTFVVVLFGWDSPEIADDQLDKKFRDKLICVDPKYGEAELEIWRQNNLIAFLQSFPSLALRATGNLRAEFETHQDWASHDDMRQPFEAGTAQREIISNIAQELRRNQGPTHIRILGEPGIGKTRLVLEATCDDDLYSLVIYSNATKFRDSNLMTELLRGSFSAILVLDECDPDSRAYVWNRFVNHSPRIKLVTIYNDFEDTSGINYFDTPLLEEEQINNIIQGYSVPQEVASRWARECSGSPRVAHVIGWNLINNPEDLLKPPGTVNVWERYIVGLNDPNSAEVRQKFLVLQYLSLFKRFGYGPPVIAEAQAIAALIQQADPQITWSRFQAIIRELKRRKILQGEHTLYITPKMLHIWLWREWWETYGEGIDVVNFLTLPLGLPDWFSQMLQYATGSEAATKIVRRLLGKGGLFQ